MQRANWFAVSPDGAKAVGGLYHFVTPGTSLSSLPVHLVFLRVSQTNGCAHCIDIHTRDLIKEGMSVELKTELFYPRDWKGNTIEQFIEAVGSCIRWYNERRIKISSGALSPIEYRQSLGLAA